MSYTKLQLAESFNGIWAFNCHSTCHKDCLTATKTIEIVSKTTLPNRTKSRREVCVKYEKFFFILLHW